MQFYKMTKDFSTVGADYVFDKLSDLQRILPYLYKKVEGDWYVILVDLKMVDCRFMLEEMTVPDYVKMDCYLKADVLGLLVAEYPKFRVEEKSKWSQYLELVSNFPKLIERKASSELFKRCKGDTTAIREALSELLTISEEDSTITMRHINSILLANDSVYARDVVLTFLVKNNEIVPKRGHNLSRYKYRNPYELYDKLEKEIGRTVAFFAIRKFLQNLYEDKLKYLRNEEVKEKHIVSVLDIYEIAHAFLVFQLSRPDQILSCLYIMEERTFNVSSFESTVLANYD